MSQRIVVNQVPIEWGDAGDRLTFFGIDAVIFWKDPSLLSILRPLREELGEELFHLLVAYEVRKGTYEDYHQMVTALGDSFSEGFANWGRAVSGAGWGSFRLEAIDWQAATARVRIDRPWELALFRPEEPDNGVPFLIGKLSGIFSWAFDTHCRAHVEEIGDTGEEPYAVLAIAPSTTTLADELGRLQEKRGLSNEAYLQAANRHLRENLDRFIDVVEATGEFIWETDRYFRLTFFTQNLTRILGLEADELRGRDLRQLVTPEEGRDLAQVLDDGLARPASQELEAVAKTPDGSWRWLDLGVTATFDLHGAVDGFRGAGRDVTDQKSAEVELQHYRQQLEKDVAERTQELERASHHNRLLLESIGEGVFGVDTAGCFTFINPAGADMLGYAPQELEGRESHALIHQRYLDGAPYPVTECPVSAVLADGNPRKGTEEPFHRSDGSAFLADLYVAPMREEGAVTGAVVSFRDIRDRKEAEQALAARAYYDELTGLPNRTHLIERAEQMVQRQEGEDCGSLLVVVLDLDRFKDINDSLGHASGDWLIQRVAARLYHRTRASETLARLGGDEFACLVSDVSDPEEAAQVARRLLQAFAEPLTVGYHVMGVGASVGLSLYPEHGDSADSLFQNASAALHQAKKEGRGHYRFYTADLTRAAAGRVRIEAALREALERNEVVVHYQPQVALATGRVVGAEALIRWQHPEWGWVSPSEFIPVAEQTGLIHALGSKVLHDACNRAAASWQNGLRLAVNISPVQLEWGALEGELGVLLSEYGVPAGALEVEVTEEAFLRDPEQAGEILKRLRAMGVGIAIDDFGSGYSSLAYLKALRVDRLKIDQSFVAGLPDGTRDAALIRAAAAMGRSLDMEVIAEGVKTERQADILRSADVDEAQGGLYGLAQPPELWNGLLGEP